MQESLWQRFPRARHRSWERQRRSCRPFLVKVFRLFKIQLESGDRDALPLHITQQQLSASIAIPRWCAVTLAKPGSWNRNSRTRHSVRATKQKRTGWQIWFVFSLREVGPAFHLASLWPCVVLSRAGCIHNVFCCLPADILRQTVMTEGNYSLGLTLILL